jgi:hypothetical protein
MIVAGAASLALLVLLFPPWRARAIRTTVRYGAVAGVAPSALTDTIAWLLPFMPVFAPPRVGITGDRMRDLAARSSAGDASARATLRAATADAERRVHVPEVMRTDGAIWRDSVLAAAGIPAASSYDLSFTLDQRWLAARLAVVALIAFILDLRDRRRAISPHVRDASH